MPGLDDEIDMPLPVEADMGFQMEAAVPVKPVKPLVGIIYPPPEVRNIVDKTASFVARNGPEFETRIKLNEQNNPKFNFLNSGDPYHAYYQHKVKEIQEGKSTPQAPIAPAGDAIVKPAQQLIDEAKKKKQSELLKQVELPFVPKDPPTEFEYMADPPSISAHDLDVVKLTAQFVARNGRQFLSNLMNREQRNSQFDFLRPQHSLFQYFTKLLEQYTKVLIPAKDVVKRLSSENRKKVLDDVKYRANWIKHQDAQRRKEEEEAEKERMAYASIDWHDFVVVETVDYQAFEQGHFPPPTTPQEVGARVLLQDRLLQGQAEKERPQADEPYSALDDTEVQDMEEDSDTSSSEDDEGPNQPVRRITEEPISKEERVIIKKGYDPKQAKAPVKEVIRPAVPEEYTISPITGERIPVSKLHEHMRIGLLDPRWKDQRDRQLFEKVNQESVYAQGFDIETTIKKFAERRSDIFGVGVEETAIGKKAGEQERIPGMPWDPTGEFSGMLSEVDDGKKDSIGPSMELTTTPHPPPPIPQPPKPQQPPPLPPPGVLQQTTLPPGVQPPSLPGIVRGTMPPMPPPPGAQPPPPGVMYMSGLGQLRPLLTMPQGGYPPMSSGPPGTMPNRPPLLTSAPPVVPNLPSLIPQQPTAVISVPGEDEPPSKKAKNLEDSLIPEDQFLATNSSPATFNILCPLVPEKPEMNLQGQMISITLELTDPIVMMKAKISEAIGLAAGKQKLRLVEGLFFKDSNSLAFYNVGDGTTVHLSLKERGGRKK